MAGAAEPEPHWTVPGAGPASGETLLDPAVLAVQEAVDRLASSLPTGSPAGLALLLRCTEQLRGLVLRELGELDATGAYRDAGAASAAAWLRRQQVIGDDSARSAVRLAARLREDLVAVGQELCVGKTTLEHVRAAAAGTAGLDPEVVRQAQPGIGALMRVAEPAVVRRQLRERAEAIDPRLAEDAARRQQARRGFFADVLAGAGVVLGGALDDEDGAVLLHGLDLEVEAGRTAGDNRGLPARRADVLVGWARRAAADAGGAGSAQDAHTVRTHLLVTCTVAQLQASAGDGAVRGGGAAVAVLSGLVPVAPPALPTGAPLLAAALRRLACDASVSLVLAAGPGQPSRVEPLYVGRSSRTVTGRQFAALVARDRSCVVRGCRARPTQCAGHHVRHWADGGRTDVDNLVLLCHRHHHDHHDRGHELQHRDGRWLTHHGWGADPPDAAVSP